MTLDDDGLAAEIAGVHLHVDGALGVQAWPWVQDGADLTAGDLVATPNVRVNPAAIGLSVARGPFTAALRIEEGTVHAGGLEAAEARVSAAVGPTRFWLGRADVPWTPDRDVEIEDQALSMRTTLSRTLLPLHATGAGADVEAPWGTVLAGASWSAPTSDAPWVWGRARIHPFSTAIVRPSVGGGLLSMDSASLGAQLLWSADLRVETDPVTLSGGWMWARTDRVRTEAWAQLDGGVDLGAVRPVAALRGERVTDLIDDEDTRWVGTLRLGVALPRYRVTAYVEGLHSVESGTPAGVVVLDGGADRPNDSLGLGLALRL